MKVLLISPHFDDAPLSCGQSLLDGVLSRHDVTVGVVYGRTNWVRFFHPTRGRAPIARAIRQGEELVNARRFGYRLTVGRREEAILRLGATDTATYLDPTFDAADSPELAPTLRLMQGWASTQDVVLAPLGIGDHIDHQLCAEAGRRLVPLGIPTAWYEDRPYACGLDDDAVAASAPGLSPIAISPPIGELKAGRIWYPSQFDDYFLEAMAHDIGRAAKERIWVDDPTAFPLVG